VDEQIAAWDGGTPASDLHVDGWVTQEWDHFLSHMKPTLAAERMADLHDTFDFAGSNGELQRSWFLLVIHNAWEPGYAALEDFLVTVGRRWLLRPLYEALIETDAGRAMAERIYERARPGYHAITRGTIDGVLGLTDASSH
jgi:hypothetical protein